MSRTSRPWHLRRKFIATVAVLPLAALMFAACSTPSTDEASSPEADPTSGGELRYLVHAEAASLDNTVLSATALSSLGVRAYAIYDALVKQDNATGELEFGTAESITSDDSVTWTIALRPDIEFSDGTPYDAEAVKYNFERHADPENASRFQTEAALIDSMAVIDDLTLEVTLKSAEAQWPQRIASGMNFIGSPTAMEELGDEFGNAPVGAGPFIVSEWRRDESLVLERNPNYYQDGLPYLDGVEFRVIADPTQRLSTLQSGAADIAIVSSFDQVAPAEAAGLTVDSTIVSGGYTLSLNHEKAPFDDLRVRQAVQLGLDRDDLNAVVYNGAGVVPDTLFVETSPFYDASATYPAPDPDAARELLADYAADTGGPASFTIRAVAAQQILAEYIQSVMTDLGAEVEVEFLQAPQLQAAGFGGDFEAISLSMAFIDPVPILHEQQRTGGGRNFSRFSDPEVDAALVSAAETSDVEVRKADYLTVQEKLIDEVSEIIVTRIPSYHARTDKVQGIHYIEDGVPRLEDVFLAE